MPHVLVDPETNTNAAVVGNHSSFAEKPLKSLYMKPKLTLKELRNALKFSELLSRSLKRKE